jgi:hypothetical protein
MQSFVRIRAIVAAAACLWAGIATAEPPRVQPMNAIEVHTEAELRNAARLSAHQDVNILIPGEIKVSSPLYFPPSNSVVRMIGIGPQAGLRFDLSVASLPPGARIAPTNGIELNCRTAVLRGLHISGFDWFGTAVKGHVRELLDISDCTFTDIGTTILSPAADAAFLKQGQGPYGNSCVGAHKLKDAHISVVNCRFENCVRSRYNLSHCLYISARSVLVTGNHFRRCGNAIGAGGPLPGAINNVFGNVIEEPAEGAAGEGKTRPVYISHLSPLDSTALMFNVFRGHYRTPWVGQPGTGRHLIDYNDYSQATYEEAWAANTNRKVYLQIDEWQALGYDRHSVMARRVKPGEQAPAGKDATDAP